jgi:hypothetical protein
MAVLCRLALESPRLEIETSAHRWSEISAYCTVVTPRMSFSWPYTLSTPLPKGAGKVSRSAAATAMFWLALMKVGHGTPSRLMAATMALARAQALVRSTVTTRSISSADL